MAIEEEEGILKRLDPNFKDLSAAEISNLVTKKLKPREQEIFIEANMKRTAYLTQAEELIRRGSVRQAIDMLDYIIPKCHFGNEYAYGLLGDAYLKKGDRKKALEMYEKSGSIDSLKKAKRLR